MINASDYNYLHGTSTAALSSKIEKAMDANILLSPSRFVDSLWFQEVVLSLVAMVIF